MRLLLVGPPGAGKGTQAQFLAAHYSIPHISTGDIFRANLKAGTDIGNQARVYMDRGELVPDDVTNEMVRLRLEESDASKGFLLDGWPRNIAQAQYFDGILCAKNISMDAVLEMQISDAQIIARLSSRRTCRDCGKPSQGEKCGACGGELYQREDDKEEVIANRLKVYADQTAPIIAFYRDKGLLLTTPATGSVADITAQAIALLSK
ncbi:MAG: adenylate kinase [Actinobacteria bacterium]|nr:adenylate kinase [Actinomycetota bacterium]